MSDIMVECAKAQYVFVILQPNDDNKDSVKIIMKEQKILACKGIITFYSSYNEILKAYTDKFPNREMWGIGFSKNTLNKHADWMGYEKIEELEDDDLIYTQIKTEGVIFSRFCLNHSDVFFVAPNSSKCKEVWFAGNTDRGFNKWWCKGIHKSCCHARNKDITDYLSTEKYEPYFSSNFTTISIEDLFPNKNVLLEDVGLKHEYTVMNLLPKELREGVIKEGECNSLF